MDDAQVVHTLGTGSAQWVHSFAHRVNRHGIVVSLTSDPRCLLSDAGKMSNSHGRGELTRERY